MTRGEGGHNRGKEGEGSSQGTCIKDPWTRTMQGWGLTVGVASYGVGDSNGEKGGTTVTEPQ